MNCKNVLDLEQIEKDFIERKEKLKSFDKDILVAYIMSLEGAIYNITHIVFTFNKLK